MSYTASCFVSASDCSASDEDTRAAGAAVSSPPRSRDLLGTRPYRTAVTEGSHLKGVGGHNDLFGGNVKTETQTVMRASIKFLEKAAMFLANLCRYVHHYGPCDTLAEVAVSPRTWKAP